MDAPRSITTTRAAQPLRLRHVVPLVGASARTALRSDQLATLDSIGSARDFSAASVEVEVVGAHFPDEEPPHGFDWLVPVPALRRASTDYGEITVPRRLPLMADVLSALAHGEGVDAVICSNIDIGLRPDFYAAVAGLLTDGWDAFTVNRRSVSSPPGAPVPAHVRTGVGRRHPGSDCFVMTPRILRSVDVGDALLGTPFVGMILLEEMHAHARRFRRFSDLAITWHRGADGPWRGEGQGGPRSHNRAQLTARRAVRGAPDRRERLEWSRLILCAAPAGSGQERLERVLARDPAIDLASPSAPSMTGAWMRDVTEQGLPATRAARTLKAVAITANLRSRRPGTSIHADLSPEFLSMFRDVVLDRFDHSRIAVVSLRRDPTEVARELRQRWGALPAERIWGELALDPVRPDGPLELDPASLVGASDRVFAHIGEVLHLRELLRLEAPTPTWVEVDAEALRTRRGARDLRRRLRLGGDPVPDRLDLLQPWGRIASQPPSRRRPPVRRTHLARELDEFLARTAHVPNLDPLRREAARWRP